MKITMAQADERFQNLAIEVWKQRFPAKDVIDSEVLDFIEQSVHSALRKPNEGEQVNLDN